MSGAVTRLASLALILLSSAGAVRGQLSPHVQDLVNMDFAVDIRVFAVMAALNAAGFDYETGGKRMSQARLQVRQALERLEPGLKARLKAFYDGRRLEDPVQDQASYVSLALLLSGPPDFKLQVKESQIPPEVARVKGFQKLVREVYSEGGIAALWRRSAALQTRELLAYRKVVKDVIRQTLGYFRVSARIALDRKIILIPDLLNAWDVVNVRNMERVYTIVVGPTESPVSNFVQLQHEHLHFLVDPLVAKHGGLLLKHQGLLDVVERQPDLRESYQNKFLRVVTESLIESILMRLHPARNPERRLLALFHRGLILSPSFFHGLEEYEKQQGTALPAYLETLFKGIRRSQVEKEEKTLEARLEEQRRQRQEEEAARRREEAIRKLMHRAGKELAGKRYGAARHTLEELLALDPENGGAFFYLAQAESQQNQHEQAFHDYQRAARAGGTATWIRAWSLVRMGRYLAFKGKLKEARRYLEEALKLEGDLRGARREARASLARLP